MKIAALAAAAVLAATTSAHALTYTGSLTAGTTTATYTIVTDGAFGVLQTSDITNFSATITSSTETQSFSSANSLVFAGSTTTATASTITFDPTQSGYIVAGNGGTVFPVICLTGNNISCIGEGVQSVFLAADFYAGDYTYRFATAPYTIATAVPEPAAWTLLIAGFAFTGAAARRRTHAIA